MVLIFFQKKNTYPPPGKLNCPLPFDLAHLCSQILSLGSTSSHPSPKIFFANVLRFSNLEADFEVKSMRTLFWGCDCKFSGDSFSRRVRTYLLAGPSMDFSPFASAGSKCP